MVVLQALKWRTVEMLIDSEEGYVVIFVVEDVLCETL